MIYDKLVRILDEATIFDFDTGQILSDDTWFIRIDFPLAGTLAFYFDKNKNLINVERWNV